MSAETTEEMRTAEDAANDSVFQNLVTQFSNALDCFRELVQNSIDAGSPRVDVWTEFEIGEGHVGTIALHVDDFGEGMDEAIIDHQLTQLFASGKEDDLTKIGKFGIGFVSVFALKPRAVLLHTGRGGEYWEVFFNPDRSFDKTRLDYPVEGTQVTIFVEGDAHRYRELVVGIRQTLKRWCVHADTEVTFEDRTPPPGVPMELEVINEPFVVEGLIPVDIEFSDRTRVVMAYNDRPRYAFFNQGLTLAETDIADQVFPAGLARRFRYVSLKVKSRYLEHTLSRDTVVRDSSYMKAMTDLQKAHGQLTTKLIAEIEALVDQDEWSLADMDRYGRLVGFLATEPIFETLEIVKRKLFRGIHGGAFSAVELLESFRRDGRILMTTEPTQITRRLHENGIPVVYGLARHRASRIGDELVLSHPLDGVAVTIARCVTVSDRGRFWGWVRHWFLRGILGSVKSTIEKSINDPGEVYLPVKIDPKPTDAHAPLIESARGLLDGIGAGYRKLTTFEPTSSDAPFFVTGTKLDEFMATPPVGSAPRALEAAVNRMDEHFIRLHRLYATRPGFAAYCLAKSLLLDQDQLLHRDLDLIAAAQKLEGEG